ncbi:response regulator transcription factor [Calycomorphotria hydatis]|uniref:Photosynthetic apparatus regulatory protein RegA n=1 Tax=Calycomorphotria hydatis TaxID=2528027 RepID=A0A517T8Z6_9PLAN|nr:response regulator [Calycomorphotria hydatis]QDT64829.1 Photosynthetic apparatus regulatory protein RegA [Calycomorphotria hydatis]
MMNPQSPVRANTILVVDDNELLRDRLAEALGERGYETHTAGNYDEGLTLLDAVRPGMAVIDLRMPGKSGLELVREIKERSPETLSVVLTGFGSIANAVDAIHAGAVNYVTKPANADEVLAAFHKHELAEEITAVPAIRPDEEVGYSPPTLAEAEWEHIQQVLSDCGGNISQAARLLGIERRTLQRKLKKMRP